MRGRLSILICLLCWGGVSLAQDFDTERSTLGVDEENMDGTPGTNRVQWGRDTTGVEKELPIEYHQWYIDEQFGNRIPQEYNDTLPHLFQNFTAGEGPRGEYMMLGNVGSPRYQVNWLDREQFDHFFFMQQLSQIHATPGNTLFTNTKCPVTAACTAVRAVCSSRISPIKITLVSLVLPMLLKATL